MGRGRRPDRTVRDEMRNVVLATLDAYWQHVERLVGGQTKASFRRAVEKGIGRRDVGQEAWGDEYAATILAHALRRQIVIHNGNTEETLGDYQVSPQGWRGRVVIVIIGVHYWETRELPPLREGEQDASAQGPRGEGQGPEKGEAEGNRSPEEKEKPKKERPEAENTDPGKRKKERHRENKEEEKKERNGTILDETEGIILVVAPRKGKKKVRYTIFVV